MPLILSQRIDIESDYDDTPFEVYHFPKQYKNKISPGDIFIYHQGDSRNSNNRFYFGFGVVGQISTTNNEDYFAEILEGKAFPSRVPLHYKPAQYYENIGAGFDHRKKPDWQNAIRNISQETFDLILSAAKVEDMQTLLDISKIESVQEPLAFLYMLNERYANYSTIKRDRIISAHIDRGTSVTNALKKILGPQCQICGCLGFEKKDGTRYIEAHHLTQLSLNKDSSLCSDNIILVCPNCHRAIHFGKEFELSDRGEEINIKVGKHSVIIPKNTIAYLEKMTKR